VEAMIESAFENAEADFAARQAAEARVEAESILAASAKAKTSNAWSFLSKEDQHAIERAEADLVQAKESSDHRVIKGKIEALDHATQALAENIMNSAVQGALKGTHI